MHLSARPNSVIQIIDIPDATENNPLPITKSDENVFNELITAQKLKKIAGVSNLFDLYELKLKVNTSDTSIENIGKMAPNLKMLNLNNSHIQSVRDLGTNLSNLTILWLSQCSLCDLDGIVSIPNIKELYLPYNEVSNISQLGMMEKLEILDLEGNNIDDISQVEFLSFCANLTSLTLKGNPIEYFPSKSSKKQDLNNYVYEDAVLSLLPQLSILDETCKKLEKTLFRDESKKSFTKDILFLQQRLKNLEKFETSDKIENSKSPSQLKRIGFSTLHEKIQKANNINTGSTNHNEVSSQLTNGLPMCGNPVQALRLRLKNKRNVNTDNCLMLKSTREDNELPISNGEQIMSDVFEELRLWRSNNCRIWDDTHVDKNSSTMSRKKTQRPHTATGFRARQYGFTCLSNDSDTFNHVLNNSSRDKLSTNNSPLSNNRSSVTRSHTSLDLHYKS
nr:leucine-rich repeat-containing protein 56 isoform X2 [Hydra vulgaris]